MNSQPTRLSSVERVPDLTTFCSLSFRLGTGRAALYVLYIPAWAHGRSRVTCWGLLSLCSVYLSAVVFSLSACYIFWGCFFLGVIGGGGGIGDRVLIRSPSRAPHRPLELRNWIVPSLAKWKSSLAGPDRWRSNVNRIRRLSTKSWIISQRGRPPLVERKPGRNLYQLNLDHFHKESDICRSNVNWTLP